MLNACLRSERVLAAPKAFGVAAKGLEPCESGRQLEQQRDQLPGGEPQQQQPDEPEQQPRVPFRSAPSSTRLPEGSGADPAAIPSPAAVLPGQIRGQKPPGASRLAEPAENSGRPYFSGGEAQSSVRSAMSIAPRAGATQLHRSGMFIAPRATGATQLHRSALFIAPRAAGATQLHRSGMFIAPRAAGAAKLHRSGMFIAPRATGATQLHRSGIFIAPRAAGAAKLRRSGMSLPGCRWAVRAKIHPYAAPAELDRAAGAVVAINMPLLTELAGPLKLPFPI